MVPLAGRPAAAAGRTRPGQPSHASPATSARRPSSSPPWIAGDPCLSHRPRHLLRLHPLHRSPGAARRTPSPRCAPLTPSRPHEEDPLASDTPADSSTDRTAEQPSTGIPPQRPDAPAPAPATPAAAVGLHRFNEADPGAAEEALLACCGSHRWALRLTLHRPYPDLASLLAAASEASYDLRPSDLAEALADESWMPQPLLGMRAPGSHAAHTALRAAHAAYEARFGHVFVVCLDGVDPEETLDPCSAASAPGWPTSPTRSAGRLRRAAPDRPEPAGAPGGQSHRRAH